MRPDASDKTEKNLRAHLGGHIALRLAEMADDGGAAAGPGGIRLRLLGAPQLAAAGAAPRALERREAALLALLAIEGPMPRSRVAALLWADADAEHARSSLRQRLFKLRQGAGAEVIEAGDVLALAAGVQHDLAPLAPRLHQDPEAGGGELLGELDYSDCPGLAEWVDVAREQWRTRRIHALAEIAAQLEAEQKIAAALPYAERLIADDPTLEHAHRRLMRLHYLRGDRAAALAAYERCRQLLRIELKVEPGAETRELARLIDSSGQLPQATVKQPPLSILRPPRMVGRQAEWQQLATAFARRRPALLLGEPGIGKSRLLGDWVLDRQGIAVGARPGDARVQYALLARLLRALAERCGDPDNQAVRAELARLLPEFGKAADGALAPERLQWAVQHEARRARARGIQLLALDDLHFADEATLELVTALAAPAADEPSWLLAARHNELPEALAQWTGAQEGAALLVLALAPLETEAIGELLRSLAIDGLDADAWAAPMARHTGGNPLFILETLRAMLDRGALGAVPSAGLPAPGTIAQLIERRLHQLGAQALALARVAAVAGQDFSAELAASVLATAPIALVDAWRELEVAHVVRDSAFAHDLVQEATLREVPMPIRRLLHRDVAGFLERSGGTPARIAMHWQQAGDDLRAARQFLRAADADLAASNRKVELQHLQHATEAFDRAGLPDEAFACTERCFHASRFVASFADARSYAERLRERADGDAQRRSACIAQAIVLEHQRRIDEALAVLREASGAHDRSWGDELRLRIAGFEGRLLAAAGRHAEGLARLEPVVLELTERDSAPGVPELLWQYGVMLDESLRAREAVRIHERVLDLAQARADWSLTYEAHKSLAHALYFVGEIERSTAGYERARALYGRLGVDRPPATMGDMILARQWRELGRFGEAFALIDAVLEEQERGGNVYFAWTSRLERVKQLLWMGQIARARQGLGQPPEGLTGTAATAYCWALAYILQAEGKPARQLFEDSIAQSGADGSGAYYRLRVMPEICRELEPAQAASTALALAQESVDRDLACTAWPLKAIACDALRRSGDLPQASKLAREICAAFESRAPMGIYPAEYWWVAYQALAEAGDDAGASAALRRGVSWVRKVAGPTVPEPFKPSFFERNPVNRGLLAAASRRGLAS
jgi:DNA-binding SARP family transcriptional activator